MNELTFNFSLTDTTIRALKVYNKTYYVAKDIIDILGLHHCKTGISKTQFTEIYGVSHNLHGNLKLITDEEVFDLVVKSRKRTALFLTGLLDTLGIRKKFITESPKQRSFGLMLDSFVSSLGYTLLKLYDTVDYFIPELDIRIEYDEVKPRIISGNVVRIDGRLNIGEQLALVSKAIYK